MCSLTVYFTAASLPGIKTLQVKHSLCFTFNSFPGTQHTRGGMGEFIHRYLLFEEGSFG